MTILDKRILQFLKATILSLALITGAVAEPLLLADDGEAGFTIVVGPDAGSRVRTSANALAEMLEKISGAPFAVTEGAGTNGLAVGVYPADFPELSLDVEFNPSHPLRREDYLLRTHEQGAWLLGATESAVSHAVWDFLYQLGYRQFFASDAWEVIPSDPAPALAVDRLEQPAFFQRDLVLPHGLSDSRESATRRWVTRNRGGRGVMVESSPIHEMIFRDRIEAFETHPEWRAQSRDGSRRSRHFCMANPELQRLVADWAIARFENDPWRDGISMTPSDNGHAWCHCEDCGALGSKSDRVMALAHTVAEAIHDQGKGPKFVGVLARDPYATAPTNTPSLHSNVIVKIVIDPPSPRETNLVTHADPFAGWGELEIMLGVNDTLSVASRDFSLPGHARRANPDQLVESIPRFHEHGARFYRAAFDHDWGAVGPGIYLASRVLWDINEAQRHEELMDDFLEKGFGAAAPAARAYYALTIEDNDPVLSSRLLGRMYRSLDEAMESAGDDARIRERIGDLVLYTRYAELVFRFQQAAGGDRQPAFENLQRFIARIADRGMINDRMLADVLSRRYLELMPATEIEPMATPDIDEIRRILSEGIARNPMQEETPQAAQDNTRE